MNNKLIFRSFNNEDYAIIFEWWNWWWGKNKGIEREVLPHDDYCYIIEKNDTPVASGFLYIDKNVPVGYLTFVVSNPDYKEADRKQAIALLINAAEEVCRSNGVKYMFSIGRNKSLIKTHEELGWKVDPSHSHEIVIFF